MSTREVELVWLLERIRNTEEFLARAYDHFYSVNSQWSKGVAACFLDFLERKKDQLDYEKYRAEKLGWVIAADQLRKG